MEITKEDDLFPPERFKVLQNVFHERIQPFQELTFDHSDLLDNENLKPS